MALGLNLRRSPPPAYRIDVDSQPSAVMAALPGAVALQIRIDLDRLASQAARAHTPWGAPGKPDADNTLRWEAGLVGAYEIDHASRVVHLHQLVWNR